MLKLLVYANHNEQFCVYLGEARFSQEVGFGACFVLPEVVGISSPDRLQMSTVRSPFTPALKVEWLLPIADTRVCGVGGWCCGEGRMFLI